VDDVVDVEIPLPDQAHGLGRPVTRTRESVHYAPLTCGSQRKVKVR
jgi:hypothetical protein